MKLSVYVLGREVATLEALGDFRSALTYHATTPPDLFVSLTMPVRGPSYLWDDQVPPIFQMNLPEGYLLRVLQEAFGPTVGASPMSLLAVVGRNMVGRLQVAAPGANLNEAATPLELTELLQGDNSEAAFDRLVHTYATSGVSGVVPKFLSWERPPILRSAHSRATLLSRFHIVKGSSSVFPYIALNEHFCMQVAGRVVSTAATQVSMDGQALAVRRFDVDERGHPAYGMEDFCVLLGMRPSAKYETTWERVAKAVRHHVVGSAQQHAMQHLAAVLLLSMALRNADCHAKNLALLYTSREDVRMAPVYDMLTTSIYEGVRDNPPALSIMGKKTWKPGKNLARFCASTFGVQPREQSILVERICDAMADTVPDVQAARRNVPGFSELGLRLLHAWAEGIVALRGKRTYALPPWRNQALFADLPAVGPQAKQKPTRAGASELLGRR